MYTGITIPTVPSPAYDQSTPHITPFNEDSFAIGPSYSQEQVPDNRPAVQTQIQDNIPYQTYAASRNSGQGLHSINSVLTMPIPGTKLAPEKFRGDFHKVKEFIQHYERLCIQNNVTLDKEKCETLLRYCSKREKQTIKNIPSYNTQIWSKLRSDMLKLYDADLDTKRYKVKDVRSFSKKQKARKIKDLAAWKRYCRKFLRIAGSLLNGAKISQKEYSTYFWQGIPKALKVRIENRILTRDPVRDLSEPFSIGEIDTAAEAILQRDRFDTALDDSDSDDAISSGEESNSEESDDDSSDSDSEDEKKHKRSKNKGKSTRRRSIDGGIGKNETSKRRLINGNRKEVEGLIRQMNLLAQDDPSYGLAYYRAMKLDADVSKVISEPILRPRNPPLQMRMNAATYQQTVQPFSHQAPPPPLQNFPPRPPAPIRTQVPNAPPPRGSEIVCYGCGERGHGMLSCSAINELLSRGLLTKDAGGRVVYKDGSPIRRVNGETFIQAYEREQRPQSHLVTVNESSEKSDSDEDEEVVYAIRGADYDTFEVERPAKQIATKRKLVMDGVYPPRLKDLKGSKENHPAKDPETGRLNRTTRNQPKPVGIPREIKKKAKAGDPVPVEVHKPRYDGGRDDQIIEDVLSPASKDILMREAGPLKADGDKTIERRPLRKSAISSHIDPFQILDHVLGTKVELCVGEVLGVSRELSGLLADSIRFKTQPSAPVGLATSFRTKTRGLLIKLSMQCDGLPIQAIIDTGSQLNIVSEAVCNSKIRRPIDRKTSVSMNDANGGEGSLHGIVENVPLNCGGVMTQANLYVGAHVPFDLLLGRPWQRGNYVSIDERRDGTYLLFKDPQNLDEARYEVLVTPDAVSPIDWDFDPSTWVAYEPPTSYLINHFEEATPEADRIKSLSCDMPDWEGSRIMSLSHSSRKSWDIAGLRNVLTDEILRYASEYLPKWGTTECIKGLKLSNEKQTIPPSERSLPEMAMHLGRARVQHESDLPSLFTSPHSTRTEAERLLMGQGDLAHFGNNNHLRHIIASSGSGVIVGHLPDQHGNPRTDVMLFNMGLLTSLAPNAPNSSIPLDPAPGIDIQHGLGILHFYPNLGAEPPHNWQIPLFVPPVTASVPPESAVNSFPEVPQNSLADSLISLASPRPHHPRPRSRPFGFSADLDSDFDYASDTASTDELAENDEIAISCIHCLTTHFGSCPRLSRQSIILNRISSNGSISSDIETQSIPELEFLSGSSDSDSGSIRSLPDDQFRSGKRNRSLIQIMTASRARRLRDWRKYDQELEEEKQSFRREEMLRGLNHITSEQHRSPTPELLVRPASTQSSFDNLESSLVASEFSSSYVNTVDPQMLKRRRILDGILDIAQRDITPDSSYSPEQILNINRSRQVVSGRLAFPDENENIPESILNPSPMEVFSITLPSAPPSPNRRSMVSLPLEDPLDNYPIIPVFSSRRDPSPHLGYPDSPLLSLNPAPLPTIVYGADATRILVQGELQEQVAEYLTSPVLYPEDRFPASLNEALTLNMDCRFPDPPSPTDTEPVDHSIVPERRQFPPPRTQPIPVRSSSPETDWEYGLQIPQHVQPFIDNHFPNRIGNVTFRTQSFSRLGPLTNQLIPIHLRTYYPYADSKVHIPIPRVDRIAVIDTTTMGFPGPSEALTHASFSGRTQIFSLLAPRPPSFETVLFPGHVHPNQCGPMDLPNVTAINLGERFVQLREARFAVISLYSRLREDLPRWLVEELDDPRFTLYVARGDEKLEKKYVDRGNFFRGLHPVYNPLITDREAMYFRGAAYAYYRFRQDAIADTIDQLLRSPHYDHHLCRELLELGCLDQYGKDEQAYQFLEQYEDHAKGEPNGSMEGMD